MRYGIRWFKCKLKPPNKLEVDEATAGLSVVDETDKDIEQDEEHVEDIRNDNHDVVGHGAMYELVQQPNDSDYDSDYSSDDDDDDPSEIFDKIANY